ncbi:MAG: mannose-1-phosphate guanylyltransferase [Treponemataceae bacterium]
MILTAVIMAGGSGTRLWPKSTKQKPKQFLSLTDDNKTLIQLTVERILPIINPENIFIITNESYKQLCLDQLVSTYNIPDNNIICEPSARNTAPAIALTAFHIQHKYDDAMMIVLPSDHLINGDQNLYTQDILKAVDFASDNKLVTIGIKPSYPETGYGYIQHHNNTVLKFIEKPSLEKAKDYVEDGNYLWNSGQFIWKTSVILEKIKKFEPEIYTLLKSPTLLQSDDFSKKFSQCKAISIDNAVMEKSSNICVIPAQFHWDDVGNWLALDRIKKLDENHNILNNLVFAHKTKNCIVQTKKKIACLGLENLIIIETENAILVCNKNNTQDIKIITTNQDFI